MGRRKAAELRLLPAEAGWLDVASPLPEDAVLAARLARERTVGSYSSVRRFLQQLEAEHPGATVILDFEPGEAAQVDFGKGPDVADPRTGELTGTWVFVMTLTWSRHQYAELVTDQKVETWLGCHRRA